MAHKYGEVYCSKSNTWVLGHKFLDQKVTVEAPWSSRRMEGTPLLEWFPMGMVVHPLALLVFMPESLTILTGSMQMWLMDGVELVLPLVELLVDLLMEVPMDLQAQLQDLLVTYVAQILET